MLQSLASRLFNMAWRSDDVDGSSSDEQEEDDPSLGEITIPKLAETFIKDSRSKRHDRDSSSQRNLRTGLSDANRRNAPLIDDSEVSRAEIEKTEGVGCITILDISSGQGVIDRTYRFDVDKFCPVGTRFEQGSKVEYTAERSGVDAHWRVVSMKPFQTQVEAMADELSLIREEVALVKQIGGKVIKVEAGSDVKKEGMKTRKTPRIIEIPEQVSSCLEYRWMEGDWMVVRLEDLSGLVDEDSDISADVTRCRIISVRPLQEKEFVGKVSKNFQRLLINKSVFYEPEFCKDKKYFPIGTVVRCRAIESSQRVGNLAIRWRAVEVTRACYSHTSDSAANYNQATDGSWSDEEDGMDLNHITEYEELMRNKCGIEIHPKHVVFPETLLGNSATHKFVVKNQSAVEVRLLRIHLSQDESHSQFEIKFNQQEPTGLTLQPNEDFSLDVVCQPRMLGKTKEICVFDFGTCMIGRSLSALGCSADEKLLNEAPGKERRINQRRAGEQSVDRVIADRQRRRIRGNQAIRSPFFEDRRIPHSPVPNVLYKIVRDRDEEAVKHLYPDVIDELVYENYRSKFKVSLWFEEIENDLRRRQYDLNGVQLVRVSSYPVMYKFTCVGVLEFQPPIHLNDTIDAFDADDPDSAKFQGTVVKLGENEVTCCFGEAFDKSYSGFPLTIQFNLGRTNYKRCHFAVQSAVDYFDRDFLFPEADIVTKAPRILTYEAEEGDSYLATDEPGAQKQTETSTKDIFRKTDGLRKLDGASVAAVPVTDSKDTCVMGKRIQSLKSRFMSDTASGPSSKTARLVWYNSNLNEEQRNAVRRILRGQARPLPYIIFGPPGTGKTVTLVEAVMQVNKLDKNSRLLVCAPSNAAADVVAEYLVQSGQYVPGEFIRLNGFLRAGQSISPLLQPFCVDGEDIRNVAMHRLIVCTCMTAGQFFPLGLDSGHFTHVFVDEAGYCTEPETMVPAILMAATRGGQLILAGDPKQLGPVLMSDVAQNCELNVSLLERLMARKLYQRNIDQFGVEKYNPQVLTKLVKNYRTHSVLLQLPSKMFYDDDLIASASYENAYALTQDPRLQNLLVSPGVPLIFYGVQGKSVREIDSSSWYNIPEAMQVAKYVFALVTTCGLSSDDIGIITPYRKQVEKIRTALSLNLPSESNLPKVASVEEFQGGERTVIIVSTVRSSFDDDAQAIAVKSAFIYQPKRFNVMITRAKALMIVIGNPHVLFLNDFWRNLLQYAIQMKAYTGCNLPIQLDSSLSQLCSVIKNRCSVNEESVDLSRSDENESEQSQQVFIKPNC